MRSEPWRQDRLKLPGRVLDLREGLLEQRVVDAGRHRRATMPEASPRRTLSVKQGVNGCRNRALERRAPASQVRKKNEEAKKKA
jgi:hypothetical protein